MIQIFKYNTIIQIKLFQLLLVVWFVVLHSDTTMASCLLLLLPLLCFQLIQQSHVKIANCMLILLNGPQKIVFVLNLRVREERAIGLAMYCHALPAVGSIDLP